MSRNSSPRRSIDDQLLLSQYYVDDEKEFTAPQAGATAKKRNRVRLTCRIFSNAISVLLCLLLIVNLGVAFFTRPVMERPHRIHRRYGSLDRAYMNVDASSDHLWDRMSVEAGIVRIPAGDSTHQEGGGFIAM